METKELQFKNVEVWGGESFIEISPDVRLYYKVNTYDETYKDQVGFEFVALNCIGWECDGKNEYEFSPESAVEVIVEGVAYFDGIRHLYYGSEKSDNYGYHYYANLPMIISVLEQLRKLEVKYCREHDW